MIVRSLLKYLVFSLVIGLFVGCSGGANQTHGVFVSVETECESNLEAVEVFFGDHSEYCGSIAKGGGYTIVGVEYTVLLDEVEIHFTFEGQKKAISVPLRRMAPSNLGDSYEVVLSVVCAAQLRVEVSFWRFVKVDGRFTRERIPDRRMNPVTSTGTREVDQSAD